MAKCSNCQNGKVRCECSGQDKDCFTCHGTGYRDCWSCGGTGQVPDDPRQKSRSLLGAVLVPLVLLFALILGLGQTARAQDAQTFTWRVQWANEDYPGSYWTHTAMKADPAARIGEFWYYLHPGQVAGGGYYTVTETGRTGLYKADPNHITAVDGFQIVWGGDSYSFLRSDWNHRICLQGATFEYQLSESEVTPSPVTIWIRNSTTQTLQIIGGARTGQEMLLPGEERTIEQSINGEIRLLNLTGEDCGSLTWRAPHVVLTTPTATPTHTPSPTPTSTPSPTPTVTPTATVELWQTFLSFIFLP